MTMTSLRTSIAVLTFLLATTTVSAQNFPINLATSGVSVPDATVVPPYDVVSVKPHPADDPMMRVGNTPDGIIYSNISLKILLSNAYDVRADLISGGPSWVANKGFDVNAKVAEADLDAYKKVSPRQREALLQTILKERFHLTVHKETKDGLVYDLVIVKGGIKMKTADVSATVPDPRDPSKTMPRGMMMMGPGMFQADSATPDMIAGELSAIVQHDVRDKTGLTGKYDLNLTWTSENQRAGGQDNGSAEHAPEIFTAVQEELGLKLVSARGPVETLVIDHAELPTEN